MASTIEYQLAPNARSSGRDAIRQSRSREPFRCCSTTASLDEADGQCGTGPTDEGDVLPAQEYAAVQADERQPPHHNGCSRARPVQPLEPEYGRSSTGSPTTLGLQLQRDRGQGFSMFANKGWLTKEDGGGLDKPVLGVR